MSEIKTSVSCQVLERSIYHLVLKASGYVVDQSSFPLIALFWLKIGGCRGENWLSGNQV